MTLAVSSGTAAVVDRVREAAAAKRKLRIRGAGTWLNAGRPVHSDDTLSVSDDRGIVEYVPGDLTLTARAGTTLAEILAATKEHAQWLPLDPWGGDSGTLGATVSTASAGPSSYAMGLPRDVVLGLEFVSGTGEVIRAGGRVVKNVAGFDLTRLLVGSWGTLGVITEITVRLRARPEHTRTIAIALPVAADTFNDIATRLRALPFAPLASEIINARLGEQLGLGYTAQLLVRVAGNEKSVRGQLELLRAFGDSRDTDEQAWNELRMIEADGFTWRWSQQPTLFGETWTRCERESRSLEGFLLHGNPARGVVRAIVPSKDQNAVERIATAANAFKGTIALEQLPSAGWKKARNDDASDGISRAIRQKFDPYTILNPGVLGGAP
jgi:glycolate oxidase FAD binding subunit